ncbi:hypothetical protein RND81_10G220300 [Saponaria officinalis]|uniref:YLP motif-containing protein 1 n=1 Tax=Saponaria officinalis TaxID=3572 RepID=A0AAW1I7G6_SAPOF
MDHSWRPRPIQGTDICPNCSISHFPFCPPLPHPSTYHGPNFEPNRGPVNMGRPVYANNSDPYHDPGHWSRNPNNLPPQVGDPYAMRSYGHVDHSGGYYNDNNSYNNVHDDRSSKRLRVDGVYPGSYGGENDVNLSKSVDGGLNLGFGGFDGGLRRFPHESSGFNGSVEGRELGNSRMAHKTEVGSSVDMGRGVHYRKDEFEYQSGYNSGFRGAPDVEVSRSRNEYQSRNHQLGPYGQVANPPNVGSFSHGYRPPSYGSNFEHVHSNGAAVDYDTKNHIVTPGQYPNTNPPYPTAMVQPGHMGYGYHSPNNISGVRQPIDSRPPPFEGYQSHGSQNVPTYPPFEPPHMSNSSEYGNSGSRHMGHVQPPQGFEFQPPLPSSPPPPLPKEPPVHWSTEHKCASSPKKESPSLFPVQYRSSSAVHYSHSPASDSHAQANPHLDNFKIGHASRGTFQGDSQGGLTTFAQHSGGSHPSKKNLSDKPRTVDAVQLFKQPQRTSRPDHFVIILRGLPGSGKSYIAKMLRDLELEHGGSAPRIHSMDDYFMTEVEKTEENEASKPLSRGKKPVTKTVIEYCYEPEMEEAYRSSMLKAFKKTLEEGVYTFVIVDDRNLRVADFAQFWATAKRSGYEAYVLEAPYKDPAGCTARNVHGFSQDEVEKMSAKWEEAPSLYLQLDVKSLFHGDDLKESNIKEVDMDTEDDDVDANLSKWDERQTEKTSVAGNLSADVSPKDERNSEAEVVNNRLEEIKELGRSKWSDDLDDDSDDRTVLLKGKANVLSGLLGTYGKDGKSVHWGDQSGRSGFSIGAVKKAKVASLIIGPGAGYNLKSNPLPEEEDTKSGKSEETKKHSMFKQRLQAEHDSFRAVFDRRRHRVGVLTEDD